MRTKFEAEATELRAQLEAKTAEAADLDARATSLDEQLSALQKKHDELQEAFKREKADKENAADSLKRLQQRLEDEAKNTQGKAGEASALRNEMAVSFRIRVWIR